MIGECYPWQTQVFQGLAEQVARERLHHALLLVGEPGIGKLDLALYLAGTLLCRSPGTNGPCGECSSCHLVSAGNHPDLFLLQPIESRFILIDEIRELVGWIAQTAQQGGRKVVVLHPAEMINHAASNALLKSLEEPASATNLVLVCNRLSALLPTIRSRCQRIPAPVPTRDMARQWLGQFIEDPGDLDAVLDFSKNRPLAARSMAEGDFLAQRSALLQGLARVWLGEVGPVASAATLLSYDLESVLNLLVYWLGDLLRYKLTGDDSSMVNSHVVKGDMYSLVKEVGDNLDKEIILEFIDRVNDERGVLASAVTANQQLLLESLMIHWSALGRRSRAAQARARRPA